MDAKTLTIDGALVAALHAAAIAGLGTPISLEEKSALAPLRETARNTLIAVCKTIERQAAPSKGTGTTQSSF